MNLLFKIINKILLFRLKSYLTVIIYLKIKLYFF